MNGQGSIPHDAEGIVGYAPLSIHIFWYLCPISIDAYLHDLYNDLHRNHWCNHPGGSGWKVEKKDWDG